MCLEILLRLKENMWLGSGRVICVIDDVIHISGSPAPSFNNDVDFNIVMYPG